MPDIDPVVILVATVVSFVLGAAYYAVLGARLAEGRGAAGADVKAPPWALVAEVLRCRVLAAVVTGLGTQTRVDGVTGGLVLGLVLWIGFPAVLWFGAIVHENVRWRLAAIHAGDWLVKLLVVGVVVSVCQ